MSEHPAPGCVTVSRKLRRTGLPRAVELAQRIGLEFQPNLALAKPPMLVVERAGIKLVTAAGSMRPHPGLGLVRLKRLVRGEGETEPLLELAEIRPGDRVFDGTFGFGQDALVFAWAVGPEGRVTAVESSPLLAGMALDAMWRWPEPAGELTKRIDLVFGDARAVLAAAPSASEDVVYLDPMFRDPRSAAPDFVVLRALANETPLDEALIADARRVARRHVIVKDAWPGRELGRLGLRPVFGRRNAEIVYGIL
jgi:16S rRNA (guanine1516-N2)-methyltransferase